ncbi:D-alanine--D-alanine ligase [Bacteroidota bacterium]
MILRNNKWSVTDEKGDIYPINREDFSCWINNVKINFDCAFMAIHGTPGEDGKLQAYFDIIGLPYTSSGFLSAAISFNKYSCIQYLKQFGIICAKSILIRKNKKYNTNEIINELSLPLFIKPNNSGSSCGITKVVKIQDFEAAVNNAFYEDIEVIVEEFINGREFTCGLIKTSNKDIIFPVTEIISKNDFFDYEAKYTDILADEITPADISVEIALECQEISSRIYDILNCKGVVRIDYILSNDKLYFLEINTVPGMSENSIIPKQCESTGLPVQELYTIMIEDALNRN